MQIAEYIASRHIEGAFREYLEALPKEVVAPLCVHLQPSANALRGLLELVEQISRRDGISSEAVLADPGVQQLLQDERLPRKERLKQVRQQLEQRRFPELSRLHLLLDTATAQVLKDCGLRLQVPKDLEGDSLQLSLTLRSAEELLDYAERLRAAAMHPSTRDVFAILRGEYE